MANPNLLPKKYRGVYQEWAEYKTKTHSKRDLLDNWVYAIPQSALQQNIKLNMDTIRTLRELNKESVKPVKVKTYKKKRSVVRQHRRTKPRRR